MSVSRDYTPHTYSGDGAQTAFPVRWVFHDTAWVRAQRIVGGVATDLANGTDYTVQQGVDVGGTLTLAAPLAAGAKLLIWRDVPFEQLDRYTNTGLFDVRVVERGMDRLTVMAQQLREAVGRCVQVRMDSTTRPDQIMNDINSALAGAQASAGAAAGSATAAGVAKDGAEVARAGAEAAKAGAEAARDEAASRILPIPVAEAAGKAVVVSVGGGYGLEGVKPFPAGTRLLFQQSTAPTGWTKDTTMNDRALRVVSGAVASGGVTGFSSIFSRTMVDSTTLVASQMPGHAHEVIDSVGTYVRRAGNAGGGIQVIRTTDNGTGATNSTQLVTGTQGSNGSHTHGLDLRLAYIDVIIATKD